MTSLNVPESLTQNSLDWAYQNNTIVKEFEMQNFSECITFINKIAPLAEDAKHHPDIELHDYKFVKITLTTHSQLEVTQKDIDLALKINAI